MSKIGDNPGYGLKMTLKQKGQYASMTVGDFK